MYSETGYCWLTYRVKETGEDFTLITKNVRTFVREAAFF